MVYIKIPVANVEWGEGGMLSGFGIWGSTLFRSRHFIKVITICHQWESYSLYYWFYLFSIYQVVYQMVYLEDPKLKAEHLSHCIIISYLNIETINWNLFIFSFCLRNLNNEPWSRFTMGVIFGLTTMTSLQSPWSATKLT